MWSWEMPHQECREASALAKHEAPANDALFHPRPTKPMRENHAEPQSLMPRELSQCLAVLWSRS